MNESILEEIQSLQKSINKSKNEISKLERLAEKYPNIKKYVGRWNKVVYCTELVNSKVNNCEIGHSCGCCRDSPLKIWPYIETSDGDKVYSSPPEFIVGEMYYSGDIPHRGWKDKLREANISESIVEIVEKYFIKCQEERKELVSSILEVDPDLE